MTRLKTVLNVAFFILHFALICPLLPGETSDEPLAQETLVPPELQIAFDHAVAPSGLEIISTVIARVLPEAPTIDGRLDDEAWNQASALSPLLKIGTTTPADPGTRVLLGHFRDVLYVGVQCDEPDPKRRLAPAFLAQDQRVWDTDSVHIFLDSTLDRRSTEVIVVNPAGSVSDFVLADGQQDLRWDSGCTARASENESGWAVEIAVPRVSLMNPANDIIGFNVVRRRPETPGEPFTWNPAPDLRGHARWLGNLSFQKSPCSIEKIEVGWPYAGRNQIRLWVRNETSVEQRLRARLVSRTMDGKVSRSRYKLTLPGKPRNSDSIIGHITDLPSLYGARRGFRPKRSSPQELPSLSLFFIRMKPSPRRLR